MLSIEERYMNDPVIKNMVDMMEKCIHDLELTPTEIRQCAMLAAVHHEQRNVHQRIYMKKDETTLEWVNNV